MSSGLQYLAFKFQFSMASNTKCDQDWQLNKKTVLERNSHMFNNPLMSDIKFTCGESEGELMRKLTKFHAHK